MQGVLGMTRWFAMGRWSETSTDGGLSRDAQRRGIELCQVSQQALPAQDVGDLPVLVGSEG